MIMKPGLRVLSAAVVVAIAACGSRDALDNRASEPGAGGSTSTGGTFSGTGGTVSGTGGTTSGTGGFGFGGFGTAGSGPIEIGRRCIACATQQCPDTTKCLLDAACRNGTLCVVATCLGAGGTPDLKCVNTCFNGDTAAATQALLALTCLTNKCTTSCLP